MENMTGTTLRERIRHYSEQGFRVVSETPTSAQLVRPRRFNPLEFVAMPIYLVEYLGHRDATLYLAVEPDGTISETGTALARSRYRRMQDRPFGQRLAIVATPLVVIVVLFLIATAIGR